MKLFVALLISFISLVHTDNSNLLQEFVVGNNAFAADVYKQLIQINDGKNFLFCPLSAKIILGLTQLAARGNTAQQLSKGLHLPEDPKVLEEIFQQILPSLKGNEKYILDSANKIYVKNGYKIKDSYKSIAQNSFGAEIQNINFEQKEAAAGEINAWVAAKTHDKILGLIDPKMLSPDTRLILINTLYFKGTWVDSFNAEKTHNKQFYYKANDHVQVDMMDTTEFFYYHESHELNAKFLQMPYSGEDVSMVIVLPNQIEGLSALEGEIDKVLDTKLQYSSKVHVQIPKFKTEAKIELTEILKNLGVKDAFEDYADFSEIGEPGQQPIKISDVIQKNLIEIDEKGTTAASATAVFAVATYSLIRPPPLKQFIADHPFIYYIKSSAGVMFVGRYVK